MKKTHHSAEAEPSVERSDNTSTSIRISSALSRCRALTLKPSLERRKGAVAVWDRTQASLRRQGGWRTNSQEWDEMLACRRKSCGELCLLLRCSYLISASTIILIPRTSLTKANQFLGFPSEVSEKLHKNSPKTKSFRPDPSHVITILVRIWNNLSALRNTQGCCSYVHLSVWMDGCGWNWVWESPIHIFQNGNTDWLYLNLVNWVSWRGGGWEVSLRLTSCQKEQSPSTTRHPYQLISCKSLSVTSYSPVTCTNATSALLLGNKPILF